ncbi:MAG: hypothetical protein M3144_03105 [Actinomycetota bacterium]|nr:hypothetical protein [Actinomycetota bacterium]
MPFSLWLRQNSEHYLLVDAQRRMAHKYGRPPPPPPHGWRDRFWLNVFAPTYRRLPWKLRSFTIHMMPGSHRRSWTQPSRRGSSAVRPDALRPAESQSTQTKSAEQQTVPETRGE